MKKQDLIKQFGELLQNANFELNGNAIELTMLKTSPHGGLEDDKKGLKTLLEVLTELQDRLQ